MAREYGKVLMSAWNDKDFCALPRRAQGTYFFLTSQSDLNRAGVITMALNRWASRCAENDKNVILDDLSVLARGNFIVVDEAEEEVLIRSFIRNDEGWKSPNVMVAVANAARQISSQTLRAVISAELAKIDTSGLSTKVNETSGRSTKDFIESVIAEARTSLGRHRKDPDVLNWGTLNRRVSERVAEKPGKGRVSERVPSGFLTETETKPETITKTSPETTPTEIALRAQSDFDAFWDAYGKKVGKGAAEKAWTKAIKQAAAVAIIGAAVEHRAWHLRAGTEARFIPHPATWLNEKRWADERPEPKGAKANGDIDWDAAMQRARAKDERNAG